MSNIYFQLSRHLHHLGHLHVRDREDNEQDDGDPHRQRGRRLTERCDRGARLEQHRGKPHSHGIRFVLGKTSKNNDRKKFVLRTNLHQNLSLSLSSKKIHFVSSKMHRSIMGKTCFGNPIMNPYRC